jgi:hypothetical protein
VALSSDGSTALIGGARDDAVYYTGGYYLSGGAAWTFTRSGSTWTQQGERGMSRSPWNLVAVRE